MQITITDHGIEGNNIDIVIWQASQLYAVEAN